MYQREIVAGVGVRVGSVDSVDGVERVESSSFLAPSLCGENWGLTLDNSCMQSP